MVSDQGPCIQSIHSAETAGLPYRRDEHLHAYTRSIRQRLLGYRTAVVSTCMSAETAGLPVPTSAKCCMRRARAPPRTSRVWLCECARIRVTTMRCGACGGGGRARARAPDGASSGAARANAPATGNARRKVGTRRTSLFTVSKENTKYPRKTNCRQTGVRRGPRSRSTPTSDARRSTRDYHRRCRGTRLSEPLSADAEDRVRTLSTVSN